MNKKREGSKFSVFMVIASIIAVLLGVGVFYWLSQFEPLPSSDQSTQLILGKLLTFNKVYFL